MGSEKSSSTESLFVVLKAEGVVEIEDSQRDAILAYLGR